jgi:hypothetical protein
MMAAALFMLACGVLLQFFPHEVLGQIGSSSTGSAPLLVQLAGALYLGFAVMNWMAKTVLIGGIYARPLAIGNFAHFLIGALGLIKYALSNGAPTVIWVLAAIYSIFAVLFGIVFMTYPGKRVETGQNRERYRLVFCGYSFLATEGRRQIRR